MKRSAKIGAAEPEQLGVILRMPAIFLAAGGLNC